MGFRFRQSFKILPGIRLNLSKTGHSWSFGAPGYTVNTRKGRARTTLSLPGTGLSYVTESGPQAHAARPGGFRPGFFTWLLVTAVAIGMTGGDHGATIPLACAAVIIGIRIWQATRYRRITARFKAESRQLQARLDAELAAITEVYEKQAKKLTEVAEAVVTRLSDHGTIARVTALCNKAAQDLAAQYEDRCERNRAQFNDGFE